MAWLGTFSVSGQDWGLSWGWVEGSIKKKKKRISIYQMEIRFGTGMQKNPKRFKIFSDVTAAIRETWDQVEHQKKCLTLGWPFQDGIGDERKMFAEWHWGHLFSAERVIQAARPIINHFLTAEEKSGNVDACHNWRVFLATKFRTREHLAKSIRYLKRRQARWPPPPDSDIILHVVGCLGFYTGSVEPAVYF